MNPAGPASLQRGRASADHRFEDTGNLDGKRNMTGNPRLGACLGGCIFALVACGLSEAAAPDHPIITEVYTDAVGPSDGPKTMPRL